MSTFSEEFQRHQGTYVDVQYTKVDPTLECIRECRVSFLQAAGLFCVIFSATLLALYAYGAAR